MFRLFILWFSFLSIGFSADIYLGAMGFDHPTLQAVHHFCRKSYRTSDDFEGITAAVKNMTALNFEETLESISSDGEAVAQTWKVYPFLDKQIESTHHAGIVCINKLDKKVIVSYHGTRPSTFSRFAGDLAITLGNLELVDFYDHQGYEHPTLGRVFSGKIHKGYSEVIKTAIPSFERQLSSALRDTGVALEELEFIFTGHSMGGGLASLASASFSTRFLEGKEPRPGQIKALVVNPACFGDKDFYESLYDVIGNMNIVSFQQQDDAVIGGLHSITRLVGHPYQTEIGLLIPIPAGTMGAGLFGHSVVEFDQILDFYTATKTILQTMGYDQRPNDAGKIAYRNRNLK